MDNLSKATIDDSCTSMYFSFNSTSANRTVEIVENDTESSLILYNEEGEQNITLGAEETFKETEQTQTAKKLPAVSSPMKAIPKRLLVSYNALSSTPTKAQLMRSVEINRGSAAAEICELDLGFLFNNKENITVKSKENQPQISEKVYSETFPKHIISIMENTQEEANRTNENVSFYNSHVSECIRNTNMNFTPKMFKLPEHCKPDLISVSPLKTNPGVSSNATESNRKSKQFTQDELPQNFNSMLKISKNISIKRKSVGKHEKPFDLLGKATRMSIVKTTLNSPARKASKKTFTPIQLGKSNLHESVIPLNNHKGRSSRSIIDTHQNKLQLNLRKSMLPKYLPTTTHAKAVNPRKSFTSEMPQGFKNSVISSLRKYNDGIPSTSCYMKSKNICNKQVKMKNLSTGIGSEFVCKICFQKFRVFSLFESHKKSHNITSTHTNKKVLENKKQCRYCDKKFAISKALGNHLIQNCTKIPPNDKKKLLFPSAQVNHVLRVTSKIPAESHSNGSSYCSVAANESKAAGNECDVKSAVAFVDIVPSPSPSQSISKIKQKSAHTGVFRTSNKQIVCHLCKTSFANILAYTQHCLSHQSTGKAN